MNDLIKNCYEVFSIYPLKDKIEGCPCCNLESSESGLHKEPLDNLSWEDLALFIFKAITTFGDIEDFKHFLPRIIELYIHDYYGAPYDIGIFFSKLDYSNWGRWKEEESEAVLILLKGWFKNLEESDSTNDKKILDDIYGDMEVYEFKYKHYFKVKK